MASSLSDITALRLKQMLEILEAKKKEEKKEEEKKEEEKNEEEKNEDEEDKIAGDQCVQSWLDSGNLGSHAELVDLWAELHAIVDRAKQRKAAAEQLEATFVPEDWEPDEAMMEFD